MEFAPNAAGFELLLEVLEEAAAPRREHLLPDAGLRRRGAPGGGGLPGTGGRRLMRIPVHADRHSVLMPTAIPVRCQAFRRQTDRHSGVDGH